MLQSNGRNWEGKRKTKKNNQKIGRTREIINSYYKRIFLILRSHVKKIQKKRRQKNAMKGLAFTCSNA